MLVRAARAGYCTARACRFLRDLVVYLSKVVLRRRFLRMGNSPRNVGADSRSEIAASHQRSHLRILQDKITNCHFMGKKGANRGYDNLPGAFVAFGRGLLEEFVDARAGG